MGKPQFVEFTLDRHNLLWFGRRIEVLDNNDIKKLILSDSHESLFSVHLGNNKMYSDLGRNFWCKGLKQDVARILSECDTCCRVKDELFKLAGTLQPLLIPACKWEDISMDFIAGLPRATLGYNSIWLIMDRLTKSAHYIPMKITSSFSNYAKLYLTSSLLAWNSPDNCVL